LDRSRREVLLLSVTAVGHDELSQPADRDADDVVGDTGGGRNGHRRVAVARPVVQVEDVVRVAGRTGGLPVDVRVTVTVDVTESDVPAVGVARQGADENADGADSGGRGGAVVDPVVVDVHEVVPAVARDVTNAGVVHLGQLDSGGLADLREATARVVTHQQGLVVREAQRQHVRIAVTVLIPLKEHGRAEVLG